MQQNFKRIFGLDLLRAMAIIFVFVSHCSFLLFPESKNVFLNFIRVVGAIGVDLFFVLSGYLIGGLLLEIISKQEFSYNQLMTFWKRRWFRTLPNYFLVLILNILLTLTMGEDFPKSILLYFLFLQNFFTGHPDYFTEAWSLSIEEFAYLLLPLLLYIVVLIFKSVNKKKLFISTTIAIILVLNVWKILYFLDADLHSYKTWSISFRKVVLYRLDNIYYGFIAVFVIKNYFNFFKKNKTILLCFGLVDFGILHVIIFLFDILPENLLWFYTFVYLQGVCLSLLLLFPCFLNISYSGIFKRSVEFISTRSYAIYLVNYSLIFLSLKKLIDIPSQTVLVKCLLLFLFVVITVILSNLIYVYFEKPILKYRDRNFSQ
jgi:peptidoglycan/LPS O-acetylase OafA/YrhL